MRKYLWMLPVVMVMVVLVGCHSNVTEVANVTVAVTTTPDAANPIDQGTAVNIRAEVTSTEDIAKVEFRIDNQLVGTRLDPASLVVTAATTTYTHVWDTTGVALGQHTIEVKAYDTSEPANTGTDTVTVNVVTPPTAPPTVAITKPAADGTEVSGNFDVDVEATANEPGATIAKIDVTFAGTTKTLTDACGTVNFNSIPVPNGNQEITAVATDSLDVTGSATRTVNVNNPPPTVAITAPAAGAEVIGDFDVTVAADAHTPGATITKVDVTFGGTTRTVNGDTGTVTFDSTTVANGAQTITAVATDSNGKTGQATRNVTVNNPTPFTVGVENVTVASGADVIVPIVMSDTTGVAGFGMTINYDQTKLELVGGDAAIVKGAAVPAGALLLPNTATPGVIRVAVAGTTNFNAAEQEILTIAFKAIGAAGPTAVDIDDTAGAPTRFEFVNAMATPIDPQPTAVDGTVTIQ